MLAVDLEALTGLEGLSLATAGLADGSGAGLVVDGLLLLLSGNDDDNGNDEEDDGDEGGDDLGH